MVGKISLLLLIAVPLSYGLPRLESKLKNSNTDLFDIENDMEIDLIPSTTNKNYFLEEAESSEFYLGEISGEIKSNENDDVRIKRSCGSQRKKHRRRHYRIKGSCSSGSNSSSSSSSSSSASSSSSSSSNSSDASKRKKSKRGHKSRSKSNCNDCKSTRSKSGCSSRCDTNSADCDCGAKNCDQCNNIIPTDPYDVKPKCDQCNNLIPTSPYRIKNKWE